MEINKVKLKKIFIGEIDGESEAIKRDDFENLFFNQDDKYKNYYRAINF